MEFDSNFEETSKTLKSIHDEAYRTIEEAISFEENENPNQVSNILFKNDET